MRALRVQSLAASFSKQDEGAACSFPGLPCLQSFDKQAVNQVRKAPAFILGYGRNLRLEFRRNADADSNSIVRDWALGLFEH